MALPGVPIAAADTGSLHLDHHAAGSRLRIGGLRTSGRTPNSLKMTALTLVRVAMFVGSHSAEPATPAGMLRPNHRLPSYNE